MTTNQPSDHEQPPPGDAPASGMGGLAHAIGARNLKIAIVAMPLVFLAVIALIILIFGKPDKQAPEAIAAVSDEAIAGDVGANPAEIAEQVAMSAGQAPGALALDGDRLAVRVDGPDGVEVVVYDLAKGEVIARIKFAPSPTAGRLD